MATTPPSQRTPPNGTPHDEIPVEVEGFSEEERQEIVNQIDEVARRNRIGSSEAFSKIQPKKKGTVFPLVVNILAVLFIAAGVFGANYYFGQRIEQLGVESRQFESAEGKILEEVQRASEQQLQAKEQEISQIREDLQDIELERQALQANMEAEISAKEQQLRQSLEEALQQERQRLESEGVSSQELEQQLREFRSQQEQQYQSAIEEYRAETMQQLEEKEQQLRQAQETAEQILAEANREKAEILQETEAREAELRQQFEQERERLTSESAEARQELERLAELRQNEQLYRDQINSMYRQIQTALSKGDRQAAQTSIADMREFLQSIAVDEAPSVARRRDIDQFILNILENEATKVAAAPDESLLEAAKTITALRSTVDEARRLQQEGELYAAKRTYNRALEMLPSVAAATSQLDAINRQEQAERIRELLAEAQSSNEADQVDQAIEQYTAAVTEAANTHSAAAGSAVEGLVEIFTLRMESAESTYQTRQREYEQQIADLRRQVAALQREESDLEQQLQQRSASTDELGNQIERKNERIDDLTQSLEQRQQRIASLSEQIDQLETEQEQLTRQYQSAQRQVANLNSELNDAVDQMAELVRRGESNVRIRAAVQRYQELQERSSSLLSSPETEDIAAAQAEFENFLGSDQVKDLFPGLEQLYEQLHPGKP
ncbi:MAG: hypothetical protein ACOC2P_00980 [Spirochaetota bacterium]